MENYIVFNGSTALYNFGNYALTAQTLGNNQFNVTLSFSENIIFSGVLTVNGSIAMNPSTDEIFLTKDTNINLALGEQTLSITALEQAGGKFSVVEDGMQFSFNEGDGALEFNFVEAERKVTINVAGTIIFGNDGKISLEDGTVADLTWADGNNLKLTSHGSTGSILLDAEKGLRITSDDENLDMTFTTSYGYTTSVSSVKGTIWYNAGKVTLEANTKLTGTGSLGGQSINVTLETIDGDGFLNFGSSGTNYGAGSGKLKVTLSKGNLASTFVVSTGSVFIGHSLFNIAVGSNIATDLQNFVPALSFRTSEAGTYTINGRTIETTADSLALTATDDYMSFMTSENVVKYGGMTFGGAGNLSLSNAGVVLGAGVDAKGFGEGESFILAESGNVTADSKIFALDVLDNIPTKITVTGAQNGFYFSRALTKESEEYLGYYNSQDIGKIFTERFIAEGDDNYSVRTDSIGLEEVVGMSDGVTVIGGASLDGNFELNYYDLIKDTEGTFTIDKRAYKVVGDSNVRIRAHFEENNSYASKVSDLNGTISGDFSGGNFAVGNSGTLRIYNDTNVDIVANENNFEIRGLDNGASLQVSNKGTYTVNSTAIDTKAGDVIVGTSNGLAWISNKHHIDNGLNNNALVMGTQTADTILNRGTTVTINAYGGNDAIVNIVDSTVASANFGNLISAGAGNDTVYNYHTYNPTIYGGAGKDSIVVSRGHKTFADGGNGNDTIIGPFITDETGDEGWCIGGYATVLGGSGNDYIRIIQQSMAAMVTTR